MMTKLQELSRQYKLDERHAQNHLRRTHRYRDAAETAEHLRPDHPARGAQYYQRPMRRRGTRHRDRSAQRHGHRIPGGGDHKTEEDPGTRPISETEPFEPLFLPKDDEEEDQAPVRWLQIRGYEMYEYADLWAYRYKLREIPAWRGGYVHWFGEDLTDLENEEDDRHVVLPIGDFTLGWRHDAGGFIYAWGDNHETALQKSKYKAAHQVIDHMRNLCNELVQLSLQKHAERQTDPRSHLAEWDAWMNKRRRIVRYNQRRRTMYHFEQLGGLLDMYRPDHPAYLGPFPFGL